MAVGQRFAFTKLLVGDLEAEVVRAAEAAGGVVRVAPRTVPQAGMTVAQVKDPEGHLVELLQHR
jgi:predicted enzyme related to lactoylglutathione lyase